MLARARATVLRAGCDEADRIRLTSSAGFGASAWLRALPIQRELQLPGVLFRAAVHFWLRTPIAVLASTPAACACGGHADTLGDHDMVCRFHDKLTRHNFVGNAIMRIASLLGISARRSNVIDMRRRLSNGAVDPTDRSRRQPDIVLNDFNASASPSLIDIVISHPTAASNRTFYTRGVDMLDAGRVAARAEGAKVRKYRAEVERSGLEFRPFGLETYGAWGPGAQRVLRQLLAYADAHGGGDTRPRYLWTAPHVAEAARQLIAVARVRGIALALVKSAAQRRRPSRGLDREHMDADFAHLRSSTPSSREGREGGARAALGALGGPSQGARARASLRAMPAPRAVRAAPSRAPRVADPSHASAVSAGLREGDLASSTTTTSWAVDMGFASAS